MTIEQWRPVPDWEGVYEVSDQGRVRSVDRVIRYRDGRVRRYPSKVLKGAPEKDGYLQVALVLNGKRKMGKIHRLAIEAFVSPCPTGMEARHLNGDVTDNRLENLEWGTPKQNGQDRIRHGTQRNGEGCHQAKLTWALAREIRERQKDGESLGSIAKDMPVHYATVCRVVRGLIWKEENDPELAEAVA